MQQIALLIGLGFSVLTFLVYFVRIPWVLFGYVPWLLPWLIVFSPITHFGVTFVSYLFVIFSAAIFQWRSVPLAFALSMTAGVVAVSWLDRAVLPARLNIQRPETEEVEA